MTADSDHQMVLILVLSSLWVITARFDMSKLIILVEKKRHKL